MNLLLLLFVIPFATIIFSIVLQKIINCPILVALTAFAVFLILAVTVFDESFLVLAIVYTILAYITAALVRLIKRIIKRCLTNNNNQEDTDSDNQCDMNDEDLNNESMDCGCARSGMVINRNYGNRRYWR